MAIDSAFRSYNNAKAVVALWVISVLLAVAVVPTKAWPFDALNWCAFAVLLLGTFLLLKYVRKRMRLGTWRISDAFIFILVPLFLFVFYVCAFIFGVPSAR